MAASPDSVPGCSPDSGGSSAGSLDSRGALDAFAVSLGAAVDLFIAARAAESASERTVEWYRMITGRAVRRFGSARPVDRMTAAELRAWLLELRETLAPKSIAGYVRGLKAFGNRRNSEELAAAAGVRALRRPRVPNTLIAPFSTREFERLLALADPRERALTHTPPRHRAPARRGRLAARRRHPAGRDDPGPGQGLEGADRPARNDGPAGRSSATLPGAIPSARRTHCSSAGTARGPAVAASSTRSLGAA